MTTITKLTPAELGWMAAVIDLKGHISRKRNYQRVTPQIVLMVDTKHYAILRRLTAMTGTTADAKIERPVKEFMRRACTVHCPEAHVHIAEDYVMPATWRWTITGVAAGIVIHNLLPYMTTDDGYTETVTEVFTQATFRGKGSGAVRASVLRLRNLGWDIPEKVREEIWLGRELTAK